MATRTRPDGPALGPILDGMYRALAEDLPFRHCLEVVADALRCHVFALHYEDDEAGHSHVELAGRLDAAELASLERGCAMRWQGQELWLKQGAEQVLRLGYGNRDTQERGAELRTMPDYGHHMTRADGGHGVGVCLWYGGPRRFAVALFHRAAAEGSFSKATMRFVATLRPHLANAFEIHKRASRFEESSQSLRAAMDRVPIGVMTLAADGCVLVANDEAERLLTAHKGIARSCDGRLLFASALSCRQFQEVLDQLTSVTSGTRISSLPIRRSAAKIPPTQILHLCTLPRRRSAVPTARYAAFLCPILRGDFQPSEIRMIQMVLDLTPAEARVVVELRRTCNLEAVANTLGVASSTVRTHLKHVFEKTGIHKQAVLLASVARIIARAPRNGR